MTMTTRLLQRLPLLVSGYAVALVVALALMACATPSYAQSVAVMVNGEPITNYDIEQRGKLDFMSTHKQLTRQEIIDELIDQKVKLKEAKQFGVDPSASDIDASFADMSSRMRITPDQLAKSLESQGVRPETLKARIKADMVWASLVRGRFKESLQVSEKEVAAAAGAQGEVKQGEGKPGEAPNDQGDRPAPTESFEYKMQPIVLIVPRGSPPSAVELRQKEAETLRGRVQTCDEANSLFKSMQNAAIREPVTKTSADMPPVLRDLLDKTPIGHLTPPETTKQGIEMVALCGRKPTTVDTPQKKAIRDKMFAEKFEAKQKAYLQQVRKAAMIEYR
jgi:peptidyl-prolyl cis-trans isomerase SurA